MADGFLSAEQLRRYGRYTGDPDTAQLARYFYLDVADRALVDVRRGEHNRLGFTVQLCTVRFLGTFLPDPTDVPWSVAAHLAAQLAIADPGVLKAYASRDATNREHAGKIQHVHGYTDFTDPVAQADLRGWLHARTSLGAESPGMLFDLATARLLEAKVLLPGPTVLSRLVAAAREQASTALWQTLSEASTPAQKRALAGMLTVPAGERTSGLQRLRRGPTSVTAAGMLGALTRLTEIRALGVGEIELSAVPAAPAANPAPPSPGTSASADPPSTGHSANLTPPETDPPTHAAYRRMIPTGGLRPWKAASLSARYDTPTEINHLSLRRAGMAIPYNRPRCSWGYATDYGASAVVPVGSFEVNQ